MLELGFDNVENDADSVLIVVPDDALVSVGCIAADHSILLAGKLGRVVAGNIPIDLLLLHLHILLLLLNRHYESSVSYQVILRF